MHNQKEPLKIVLREYAEDKSAKEKAERLGIDFPLYMNCYEEALGAVLKNIRNNRESSERQKPKSDFYINVGKEYTVPLNSSNIIAFMGGRGSGKTTAIGEFCRILHEYLKKQQIWKDENPSMESMDVETRFHVLAPIDASVLNAKEDLIELIWANMYQTFERYRKINRSSRRNDDLEKRIIQEFDDVYKNYINVGNREPQGIMGESVLAKLKNTSSSLKTKEAFQVLVQDFLCMLEEEVHGKLSYLVVTIDDLDMSLENGYEMLEQLHKYLSDQRVIVLIAIKYEQLRQMCEKHYIGCMMPPYGSTHAETYKTYAEKAKKLSSDYLLKVLPLSNRIYMPEQKMIYKHAVVLEGLMDETKSEVKDFILRKIALKMGIFYDINGVKKHFCLPDTVRELVSYHEFLDSLLSMAEIEKARKEDRVRLHNQNHEWFNRDLSERMAAEILDDEQAWIYKLILDRNLERRASYAVEFLSAWIESRKHGWLERPVLTDMADPQQYHYAQLLEVIYYLGRINYQDKVLCHCLLASFTSEMVQEYHYYHLYPQTDHKKNAAKRLKSFIGSSFGGEWFNEAIPTVVLKGEESSGVKIAYAENMDLWNVTVGADCSLYPDKEVDEAWEELADRLASMIPYLECATMLFSNLKGNEGESVFPEWIFTFKEGVRPEEKKGTLEIKLSAVSADFDIFGFIGKEIRTEKSEDYARMLYQKLINNLVRGLKVYWGKCSYRPSEQKQAMLIERIYATAERQSLWKKSEQKNKQGNKVYFPFYNFDMSYNIMKRVRKKIEARVRTKDDDIYEFLREVYGFMAEELYREEEAYRKIMDKKNVPEFYEDFVTSPFINAFGVTCENTALSRKGTLSGGSMNHVLYRIVQGMSQNLVNTEEQDKTE